MKLFKGKGLPDNTQNRREYFFKMILIILIVEIINLFPSGFQFWLLKKEKSNGKGADTWQILFFWGWSHQHEWVLFTEQWAHLLPGFVLNKIIWQWLYYSRRDHFSTVPYHATTSPPHLLPSCVTTYHHLFHNTSWRFIHSSMALQSLCWALASSWVS